MLETRLESLNMSEIILFINEVIDQGNKEEIEELKNITFSLIIEENNVEHGLKNATLMMGVIIENDEKTLEKMINNGFDYNSHITGWDEVDVRISPLILACIYDYSKIVTILLNHNAHFSGYQLAKKNLFETAARNSDRKIIELLINHAKNQGNIKALLSRTSTQGENLVTAYEPASVIANLIEIILTPQYKSALTLKDLRIFSPLLKDYFQSTYKVLAISNDGPVYKKAPEFSFFQSKSAKKIATENALIAYKRILDDPLTCFSLLQKLEKNITLKLQNKLNTNHLEDLFSTEHTLESHYIMKWPVPKSSYQPSKLDSLLSCAIIEELQKFGCGRSSYKWYGYVEPQIADAHIIEGAHITEDTLDISALLHGKYSHSIQLLILMYAIEANLIDISYGADQKLEISDLLRELVTASKDGIKPWQDTNDAIYLFRTSFSGPHFLHSVLMVDGHKHDLPNLEKTLKNSFCKALIRSMEFYNKHHDGEFSTPKDLWDNLISLHHPRLFLSIDKTNHFFPQSRNSIRVEKKIISGIKNSEEEFIVSKKSFTP